MPCMNKMYLSVYHQVFLVNVVVYFQPFNTFQFSKIEDRGAKLT